MNIAAIKGKLRMYRALAVYFNQRLSFYRRRKGFSVVYSRFLVSSSAAATMFDQYQLMRPHIETGKDSMKQNLCILLSDVGFIMEKFVRESPGIKFKGKTITNVKTLLAMNGPELSDYCRQLKALTATEYPLFTKYGIGKPVLERIELAADFYDAVIAPAPRAYTSLLETQKKQVEQNISDTDLLLNQSLDILVEKLCVNKRSYSITYRKIRKIKTTNARRRNKNDA